MFKDETDTVGTTRVSVSAKGGVNVLSTRQVQVASDNGISLRSSNHRVSLMADNDILSLYGKSLQAGTDSASVAMDNGDNVDINAVAGDFRFVFKDGTEREVLLSELLDHMAALERESISLRTDVECLKENSGGIGGGGSHIV